MDRIRYKNQIVLFSPVDAWTDHQADVLTNSLRRHIYGKTSVSTG